MASFNQVAAKTVKVSELEDESEDESEDEC